MRKLTRWLCICPFSKRNPRNAKTRFRGWLTKECEWVRVVVVSVQHMITWLFFTRSEWNQYNFTDNRRIPTQNRAIYKFNQKNPKLVSLVAGLCLLVISNRLNIQMKMFFFKWRKCELCLIYGRNSAAISWLSHNQLNTYVTLLMDKTVWLTRIASPF